MAAAAPKPRLSAQHAGRARPVFRPPERVFLFGADAGPEARDGGCSEWGDAFENAPFVQFRLEAARELEPKGRIVDRPC